MFPEFRDLISTLKGNHPQFSRLLHRHNELDQHIKNMEAGIVVAAGMEIEKLKKEKLQLKDQLYSILKTASAEPDKVH